MSKRGRRARKRPRNVRDQTLVYERSASYRWRGWRTRAPAEPVTTLHIDPKTGEVLPPT